MTRFHCLRKTRKSDGQEAANFDFAPFNTLCESFGWHPIPWLSMSGKRFQDGQFKAFANDWVGVQYMCFSDFPFDEDRKTRPKRRRN